jgi:hypothetical protein
MFEGRPAGENRQCDELREQFDRSVSSFLINLDRTNVPPT